MTLSTSPDVLAAHLAGEAVLLNLLDKSYYRLNETAAAVWAGFEKGESRDQILAALIEQYSVEKDVVERELDSVIDEMKTRKLLVEN
ncbi:MAG TPA: PqqD family protein [Gemmatimonadaceae bacterium]